jgi:hypothetical protein
VPISIPPDSSGGGGGLKNPALVAFIVVISVAGAIAVGLLVFWFVRRVRFAGRADASLWEEMIDATRWGGDATVPEDVSDPASVLETRLLV